MKHWIEAARVRTLPLSVSGIIVGTFYAMSQSIFRWDIFIWAIITTIGLQVLSNFANDYGDGIKGTDNNDRVGPKRAIQKGVISPQQMKIAIYITTIITFLSALILIYSAFNEYYFGYSLVFFVLGILAIASAIRYTIGKNAYGYSGYGDFFVFIFFGLVSTIGVYFMQTKSFDHLLWFPAVSIGFLSMAVLNLNNMRDQESDKKSNKNTIVVKNGNSFARKYHFFLIIGSMISLLIFAWLKDFNFDQYLFVIVFFPLLLHLNRVYQNKDPKLLDPELKKVALSTFFLSVLLGLCMIFFISDILVNR
jgi:1,4-dihydroxy-2-naphthoate octaprenyltransferase